MPIEVKSGATTDVLSVDATSKAARTTLYDSAGHEKDASDPLPVIQGTGRGTFVGNYTVTSFRTIGVASNPHNLFTIWNPAASGKKLAVKRITLQLDHTTF